MKESKLVIINDFSDCGETASYILALNESQIKLLNFLFDKGIIDEDRFGWTTNVTDSIVDT